LPRSQFSSAFNNHELVPDAWLARYHPADVFVFNPALTCFRDNLIMAYRVVLPDGRRRIAACRLDQRLNALKETICPLSDMIQDAGDWHADPRFCIYGERLFLHFNNGARNPNQIYLLEIDPDTLNPTGTARELCLEGPRQYIEKNWILFEHDGELYGIYTVAPHTILKFELGNDGPVRCRRVYQTEWDSALYSARYGPLRGGTPPIRIGGEYYAFFHSAYRVGFLRRLLARLRRRSATKNIRYVGGFYGFSAAPPFAPTRLCTTPVLIPPRRLHRRYPQLNIRTERVAYPVGVVQQGELLLVSYGANDETCHITAFELSSLLAATNVLSADIK
jgi:hypothetical protein